MKITLVSWTPNPIKVVSTMVRNMNGEMHHNLDEIPIAEAERDFAEILKTSLQEVFEFVSFSFQIEDIPRALTHQMVRTHKAFFSQESMRFTVKTEGFAYHTPDSIKNNAHALATYEAHMKNVIGIYNDFINTYKIPTQDARNILPIATMTKIGVTYTLRTLLDTLGKRMCTQSQPEWRQIADMMIQEIREKVSPIIADAFAPICERTKQCMFTSKWDRNCPNQKKWNK